MVRPLDPSDFRAHRKILEPNDFALCDGETDPAPTDLISEVAWDGIMTLPDDVAVRTTSYQGERIELLYDLWAGWIESMPRRSIVADAMLDSADDLSAAVFNLVHGFYKQAISSLRSALETTALACECTLTRSSKRWKAWQSGSEVRYADICKALAVQDRFLALETNSRTATGGSIFPGQNGYGNAWARNLYYRLSKFSHARGDSTNGHLWKSNGPIYSEDGMRVSYHLYVETYALLIILLKVTYEQFRIPDPAKILFRPESIPIFCPEPFADVCVTYSTNVFAPHKSVEK